MVTRYALYTPVAGTTSFVLADAFATQAAAVAANLDAKGVVITVDVIDDQRARVDDGVTIAVKSADLPPGMAQFPDGTLQATCGRAAGHGGKHRGPVSVIATGAAVGAIYQWT